MVNGVRVLGAAVKGGCQPPDVSAGDKTLVLYKSRMPSWGETHYWQESQDLQVHLFDPV